MLKKLGLKSTIYFPLFSLSLFILLSLSRDFFLPFFITSFSCVGSQKLFFSHYISVYYASKFIKDIFFLLSFLQFSVPSSIFCFQNSLLSCKIKKNTLLSFNIFFTYTEKILHFSIFFPITFTHFLSATREGENGERQISIIRSV